MNLLDKHTRMPLQTHSLTNSPGRRAGVPEPIARMAYAEYERQYGSSQSFDRLHERGGFGAIELMLLLCQRIAFLEARFTGVKATEARVIAREWPPAPQ